jgi:serine kinase of HPr protein (carbohydrate metabolism regulator)
MLRLHASCVEWNGSGVLLRGPSGAGKSDLALRLIEQGARLVADDQVLIEAQGGQLIARAPTALAGLLEVRGIGIVRQPFCAASKLSLIVDLVAGQTIERLPEPGSEWLAGLCLPVIRLDPFAASAPAKLRLALTMPRASLALPTAAVVR